MAILDAIGINCIEVWWSTDGCSWNGALASGNHLDVVLQHIFLLQ
jgi:hypothetical protein